ncbi:MAG: serine hydrolase domain-containing protein [Ruminococcus sp.]|nr:serine hydrolase domain-containing protein [Ruminococcus sp.]
MKKLLVIFLCTALALSSVACSLSNTESSNIAEGTTISETKEETKPATPKIVDDKMREQMDNTLKEFNFEGIVCLTKDGSIVYEWVTGKDEKGTDLTIDSTLYLGSVSKQFCATAIMILRDQGKLSVDDTLDIYFPEYKYGKDITIKNLLSMRSGITDRLGGDVDINSISPDNTDSENTAAIKKSIFSQPLSFDPDTAMAYCNTNYFLLANIVEQVSGQGYKEFVRENIFEPLGMKNSGFVDEVKDNPEWASGITYNTFTAGEDCPGLTKGAGDVASNAADMDAWMTGLSSGKVVSVETYREMITDHSPDYGTRYGYGLQGMLSDSIGHAGHIGSYYALDLINEKSGYNLFIVSNRNSTRIRNLPYTLMKDLLAE